MTAMPPQVEPDGYVAGSTRPVQAADGSTWQYLQPHAACGKPHMPWQVGCAYTRPPAPLATYTLHNLCALLPMMGDDELDDLALAIQAYGQLEPVVVDSAGVVIDGKCRLAACWRANVAPTFVTMRAGEDVHGYWERVNLCRHTYTPGQQAMATALAQQYCAANGLPPLPGHASAANPAVLLAHQAAVVLRYAPELADGVLAGEPLDDAYIQAIVRQRQGEREAAEDAYALGVLRHHYPTYVGLVGPSHRAAHVLAAAMAGALHEAQAALAEATAHAQQHGAEASATPWVLGGYVVQEGTAAKVKAAEARAVGSAKATATRKARQLAAGSTQPALPPPAASTAGMLPVGSRVHTLVAGTPAVCVVAGHSNDGYLRLRPAPGTNLPDKDIWRRPHKVQPA